ncbi:condensation domain-containing protein [Tolypothrix sp. VBCCA 56010]|uniref:condensation domain-containing protein n=1 Tax=Tolypothrix sp. VBCCA 56010 TaxID=3137731 RepID=UPI003D7ED785
MKSSSDFLSDLEKQDIKVWVEGDRLRCNAPKKMLTPELRAELTTRKQDLIAYLQQAQAALEETPSIRLVDRSQDLPLSWTQQRLWFLDRLEGGSNAAYNLSTVLEINGNLNVKALEQTLAEIIRRHEILRTTFKLVNGTLVQAIASSLTIKLPVIDLQQYSEAEKATEVRRLALEEISRTFDLVNGPLVRNMLLRLGSQSHVLLMTIHHIVFDGWSTAIFIKELSTLYQAFAKDLPSPLAELPIQYADFAVWQRQWLEEDILKPKLDYWKQKLAGTPALLELPSDRDRPLVDSMRGDSETFQLNTEITEKLKNLSKRSGATLYMILLAALATLLFRYSSQSDIVIGSPIANRYPKETEPLIGLFINTLVLRLDLSENPTFLELLNRVRQVTLEAYENQNVPFEKLVKELNIKRDLSRNPLFQVWYTLQDTAVEGLGLSGLQVRSLEFETPTAIFDLEFILEYIPEGIKGRLRYKTDLFEASTIVQMLQHFQTLLQSIVAEPEHRLRNLRLLTDEETGGYSTHDFPDAELSQSEFEKLMMEIGKISVR